MGDFSGVPYLLHRGNGGCGLKWSPSLQRE